MTTILIIDDNEADLFLDEMIIQAQYPDATILKAMDGTEALSIIEGLGTEPDIILLDINMPRMDGHQFLKIFTEDNYREVPVIIMLTSSEQDRDKSQANQYKCVKDYFLKPLTTDSAATLKQFIKQNEN